jgi:hypothetical protein
MEKNTLHVDHAQSICDLVSEPNCSIDFFKIQLWRLSLKVERQFRFSATWIHSKAYFTQRHKLTFFMYFINLITILVKFYVRDVRITLAGHFYI